MKETRFFKQAELLLQILPFFSREGIFALKGGTAINFFIRDLPRFSVDIDLTYLPINTREEAIGEISECLDKTSFYIEKQMANLRIQHRYLPKSKTTIGLLVKRGDISVKIEPNLVLRGAVLPITKRKLCSRAEELFERSITFPSLAFEDIYGGKICAALDRQHPRDLFDVQILLENEGLTDEIRKAFVVYLISHPRPMIEILKPNYQDVAQIYENEFRGMTIRETSCESLIETRDVLVHLIKEKLTLDERRFILSVKKMEPQWDLLGIEHIKELPAVKWKLVNLHKMDRRKHQKAVEKLQEYLEL